MRLFKQWKTLGEAIDVVFQTVVIYWANGRYPFLVFLLGDRKKGYRSSPFIGSELELKTSGFEATIFFNQLHRIWSDYGDLTRPISSKRWLRKISRKSRLVKYYNSAR